MKCPFRNGEECISNCALAFNTMTEKQTNFGPREEIDKTECAFYKIAKALESKNEED